MSRHRLARSAALAMLALGAIALGWGAVRASVALDQRFQETRYVVGGSRGCPLGRASPWSDQLEAQCR